MVIVKEGKMERNVLQRALVLAFQAGMAYQTAETTRDPGERAECRERADTLYQQAWEELGLLDGPAGDDARAPRSTEDARRAGDRSLLQPSRVSAPAPLLDGVPSTRSGG